MSIDNCNHNETSDCHNTLLTIDILHIQYIDKCMYIYIHIILCMYSLPHICKIYIYMYTNIYIYIYISTSVSLSLSETISLYLSLFLYIYIHLHIYIYIAHGPQADRPIICVYTYIY